MHCATKQSPCVGGAAFFNHGEDMASAEAGRLAGLVTGGGDRVAAAIPKILGASGSLWDSLGMLWIPQRIEHPAQFQNTCPAR